MKLTVLGRYGPFPAPGGACSSYLVEAPAVPGGRMDETGVRVVLDLGAGTLSRLLEVCPLRNINAILLSHLHSDHMSDMLVLRYALQQLHKKGIPVPTPLHVVAPGAPETEFRMLASAGTFDMVRAEDGMRLRFGALSITFHRMLHPVPSFAMDILEEEPARPPTYGDEPPQRRIVYTGDTGWHEGLVPLCKNASLLLADTGLLAREKTTEFAPHLTAREAGALARSAGVGRLICSHIWGGGITDEEVLQEARIDFPRAEIAQEMMTYEV
ncbi:MAG: MBL fold metallo-hydrolase [Bacillota bacterium]